MIQLFYTINDFYSFFGLLIRVMLTKSIYPKGKTVLNLNFKSFIMTLGKCQVCQQESTMKIEKSMG
ncbi:MAG: hypothetical protein Q4F97_08560, partial [Bacteroidales bacterium]|nr:hypothetical protein [Bacteroidales bacterium]